MNVLVPLSAPRTITGTVEYAVERLLTQADDREESGTLYLAYIQTSGRERGESQTARDLLESADAVARDRAAADLEIRTVRLAEDRYLSTPHDHAAVLAEFVREHGIDLVVLDPGFSVDATDPRLQPIEDAFDRVGLPWDRADIPDTRRPSSAEVLRFGAAFFLAFGFYLAVGTPWEPFDLVTGAVTGIVAGVLFRNVTFEITPSFRRIGATVSRGALFAPYLLWRILTANVQISYLVLHPALPIDPHLDRFDAAVDDGITITALANSLTLTPGTLTVDAERSELLVHSITPETRFEVLAGERERAIRFVFYGRTSMDIPGPLDRNDVETIVGPIDSAGIETKRERPDTGDGSEHGGNADE